MNSKTRKIKFEVNYDPKLEHKILVILNGIDYDNYTLLNISNILGPKYNIGSKSWDKLQLHLIDMGKRGLIEERHFGENAGDWNGIVDYAIENKGMDKLKHHAKPGK